MGGRDRITLQTFTFNLDQECISESCVLPAKFGGRHFQSIPARKAVVTLYPSLLCGLYARSVSSLFQVKIVALGIEHDSDLCKK